MVSMSKVRLKTAIAVFVLLGISGPAASGDWVMRAGDVAITADELKVEVERLRAATGLTGAPPLEQMQALARNLYKSAALANAAEQRRLAEDPEVQAALLTARRGILTNALLRALRDKLEVPDLTQAARDHYDANPDKFTAPERIMASHIMFALTCDCVSCDCLAEREQQAARVKEALSRIQAGEPFAIVAKEMSDDRQTAGLGGSLGVWATREELDAAFGQAAFELEVGEVSDLVTTRLGWHIIRLDQRAAEMVEPFEQVKDSIIRTLRDQYVRERLAELMAAFEPPASAEWNTEALEGLRAALESEAAPGGAESSPAEARPNASSQ